jgi:hypothetical protein
MHWETALVEELWGHAKIITHLSTKHIARLLVLRLLVETENELRESRSKDGAGKEVPAE